MLFGCDTMLDATFQKMKKKITDGNLHSSGSYYAKVLQNIKRNQILQPLPIV